MGAAAAEGVRAGLAPRIGVVTGVREAEIVALAWDDLVGAVMRTGRRRHSIDGQALVRERTRTGGHGTVLLDTVTVAAI